jgi:anthranilate phosphoribosyltransferase
MEQIRQVMKQMITVSEEELNAFLTEATIKSFKRQEIICQPNSIPKEIFFMRFK